MNQKRNGSEQDIHVGLGGMGLYGTTSNEEIAGYQATGDIENTGKLDNLKKERRSPGAMPR
ncbi:hypothetical protein D0469_10770 [Peribacillus saganii]|uniref:Uncharacterized protein n=1 Tax=Peribacillus saganii TaxID=2303992 RepID=A0A372LNM2_9BACI|nr:hypothetical protein [Peribacillus saganii]RFU68961.1 hypothetical protein D0469_10770 [Peribacillus saganii]